MSSIGDNDPAFKIWPEITCTYPYTQKMCNGFSKLFRFISDNHLDSVVTFDAMLLSSFILIFLAFLVVSMLLIFENEQKSLQQIKEKVRNSTAAIAQLAATLWAIRETKFKSITPEGYRRIKENRDAIMALKDPLPPAEQNNIPKEFLEKTSKNTTKKKFVRGFKNIKRELSPSQVKSAPPCSTLKRSRIVQQQKKKTSSISSVQNKRLKNLRAVASDISLNKRQSECSTPRSVISEGITTTRIPRPENMLRKV